MKIGGGLLLWSVVTVVFFRWHADTDAADREARRLATLEAELDAMTRSD